MSRNYHFTPLQIAMMIHYYAIAEPYALRDPAHANSRAVHSQRITLQTRGLLSRIENDEIGWCVTDLGRAYVEKLTQVKP